MVLIYDAVFPDVPPKLFVEEGDMGRDEVESGKLPDIAAVSR
jgi:hypothetical protein